jgi:hypothetical protein
MGLARIVAGVLFLAAAVSADVHNCTCDPARPESLEARECSLCREAEKQPGHIPFFFLKDINPRKPNRWLVLPRVHGKGPHPLPDLPAKQRSELWTAAIEKAKSLFGEQWGLAVNGNSSRTQCHAHIHVGRLLEGVETASFVRVQSVAEIPAIADGSGFWIHPEGSGLHVHTGEEITETVLVR